MPENGLIKEPIVAFGDQPMTLLGFKLFFSRDLFNILWMGLCSLLGLASFIAMQVTRIILRIEL